jgi:drug/metabolite transporter (DMT)-like permease
MHVRLTQRIGMTVRTVVGTAWAAAMCTAGILILSSSRGLLGHIAQVRLPVGICLLAGGLFVFMVLVADRWFRHASKPMIWAMEAMCLCAFLGAPLMSVLSALFGSGD